MSHPSKPSAERRALLACGPGLAIAPWLALPAAASAQAPAGRAAPSANAGDAPRGSRGTASSDALGTVRVQAKAAKADTHFTFAQVFPRGAVARGRSVIITGGGVEATQVDVRNRWRDGSLKIALLTARARVPAGTQVTFQLVRSEESPPSRALEPQDIPGGARVEFQFDPFGRAAFDPADWSRPFMTCASGPEMSSWVYVKPIGSDPHLRAWVELRLYRGGAVEFLPWIENGFLNVPAPGERIGNVTLRIGGRPRFARELQLFNHQRAVLVEGAKLTHWLEHDPEISVRHDMRLLQRSGLVPTYCGRTAPDAKPFKELVSQHTPLAQHNYPNGMGAGGYHPSIGPLPEWDVLYMTSDGDPRAWRAVQVHGYAAGRYGYHFRDEATQRAPLLSRYPHLALGSGSGIGSSGSSGKEQYTPNASGGKPPSFNNTHMPAIGYFPYLLTGRWFFMDETQLLAATVLLKQNTVERQGELGIVKSSVGANTTRGAAWGLRALAHAAAITPDADGDLREHFLKVLENNIAWYHERYIVQTSNPLGVAQPYSNYKDIEGIYTSATWMEDFLTWSLSNIRQMGVHREAFDQRLDALLHWKFRSIVGRLGPNTDGAWTWRKAAPYTMPYAPTPNPDWAKGAGPWYPNWGAAARDAKVKPEPGNTLLGSWIDDLGMSTGYWGNLQPAISAAVDFGAEGAAEAYARMTGAANWPKAAQQFDTVTPVWGVCPASVPMRR